jgi:uncharacterized protein
MKRFMKIMLSIGVALAILYVLIILLVYLLQRSMLYFPSHRQVSSRLMPWSDGLSIIGYCRNVPKPQAIWLMMHGNAGQAADREYVLNLMAETDSLYVLEYPGYGARPGRPTRESMNRAASEAYQLLRACNPGIPVCVLAESIGSGPACALASEKMPPNKIVLAVPFDTLASVGAERMPFLPVRLLLRDGWDNVQELKEYKGSVEIYGAIDDLIIPIHHARTLAGAVQHATFIALKCGHNDWSQMEQVKIQR